MTEKEFRTGIQHDSDCALHNMPAYPNEECDCEQGAIDAPSTDSNGMVPGLA